MIIDMIGRAKKKGAFRNHRWIFYRDSLLTIADPYMATNDEMQYHSIIATHHGRLS